MSAIRVGVVGYNRLGKRVVDASVLHPEMSLQGVFPESGRQRETAVALGLPIASRLEILAESCEVMLVCGDAPPDLEALMVFASSSSTEHPMIALTGGLPPGDKVRVPCADAVSIGRLLLAIGPIERLFSNCACRAGHATEHRCASVDALEPLFESPIEDADLRDFLAPLAPAVFVRRTRVPYSHSHLHHLKFDLRAALTREEILARLRSNPLIRVARAAEGFANTAQVQEFDRDIGRSRGDRPEVFVWEESIEVVGARLFMTADVSPDSAVVPEILDTTRQLALSRRHSL